MYFIRLFLLPREREKETYLFTPAGLSPRSAGRIQVRSCFLRGSPNLAARWSHQEAVRSESPRFEFTHWLCDLGARCSVFWTSFMTFHRVIVKNRREYPACLGQPRLTHKTYTMSESFLQHSWKSEGCDFFLQNPVSSALGFGDKRTLNGLVNKGPSSSGS